MVALMTQEQVDQLSQLRAKRLLWERAVKAKVVHVFDPNTLVQDALNWSLQEMRSRYSLIGTDNDGYTYVAIEPWEAELARKTGLWYPTEKQLGAIVFARGRYEWADYLDGHEEGVWADMEERVKSISLANIQEEGFPCLNTRDDEAQILVYLIEGLTERHV